MQRLVRIGRGALTQRTMKEMRNGGNSLVDVDGKSGFGGGLEDVYGEDRVSEDQLVTPWIVSVAR